ncbi:MAG: S1 RNA-binding domain-containing protein [Anaerolineales bacterium]|nr:S1 RNA-binding domain-containing protein [Anaerolineales bacterium]
MKYKDAQKTENTPPMLDDSWWASVMADEESHVSASEVLEPILEAHEDASSKIDLDVDWDNILKLQDDETALGCHVVGYNRGGLLVDGDGFHGFVPISHLVEITPTQMDREREPCLAAYVGRDMKLKVIECDPQRGRVVLSERAAQCAPGERQKLFDTLETGKTANGCVTNITDFGVFIDLGGVEGLVHISELSWGRVSHPSEFVEVGETLKVLVLQVDGDRGRVALSVKRLYPNPWETVAERYALGEVVEVMITDIVQFGAFARLEEGLEGLIHVSQMGMEGSVDPWKIVSEGERINAQILQIDAKRQRMSLKLEDVMEHPQSKELVEEDV